MNYPRNWRHPLRKQPNGGSSASFQPPHSLQIYDPETWLPEFGRPAWLANLTLRERLRRARTLLLRRGCRKIVLYLWRPHLAPALDLMAHDLSCYHIDDEYSFSPQELPLTGQEMQLIKRVGHVFIHSSVMMEKKGSLNPHTTLIPNGVDYASYSASVPEPEDLRHIRRPRIGYCGMLKSHMDWELLMALAAKHPEWSFVFVGAVNPGWSGRDILDAMAEHSNVHFLGSKTTEELAHYPQHFQLCLMPYRVDGYTKFINPLKLQEYLASGTPVVGSAIPALKAFAGIVSVAETAEEWSRAIAQGLSANANSPAAKAARQTIAQAHDWDALVANIAEAMLQHLSIYNSRNSSISSAPSQHRAGLTGVSEPMSREPART